MNLEALSVVIVFIFRRSSSQLFQGLAVFGLEGGVGACLFARS